jgi:REP element-mobilizing transposase RayT
MNEWFGQVKDGTMIRNAVGEIAHTLWKEIPIHHDGVALDEFIFMPNHVHGIIVLTRPDSDVACNVATKHTTNMMSEISPKSGSLGSIIRSLKSGVANWCHSHGYPDFSWQSKYHDHIIRNKRELNAIRNYIRANPAKWEQERNNSGGLHYWTD